MIHKSRHNMPQNIHIEWTCVCVCLCAWVFFCSSFIGIYAVMKNWAAESWFSFIYMGLKFRILNGAQIRWVFYSNCFGFFLFEHFRINFFPLDFIKGSFERNNCITINLLHGQINIQKWWIKSKTTGKLIQSIFILWLYSALRFRGINVMKIVNWWATGT